MCQARPEKSRFFFKNGDPSTAQRAVMPAPNTGTRVSGKINANAPWHSAANLMTNVMFEILIEASESGRPLATASDEFVIANPKRGNWRRDHVRIRGTI
jgi:hypothetical protein